MFENDELTDFFVTKVSNSNYEFVSYEWLNVFKSLFTFVNKRNGNIKFNPKPIYRPNYVPIGSNI